MICGGLNFFKIHIFAFVFLEYLFLLAWLLCAILLLRLLLAARTLLPSAGAAEQIEEHLHNAPQCAKHKDD
jgi:hypothetical protein